MAQRYTRMAQIGAAALLVIAVGAYAVLRVPTEVEAPREVPVANGPGVPGDQDAQADLEVVAMSLSSWDKPEPTGTEAPPEQPPVTAGRTEPIRYLGAIAESDRRVAIVAVNGRQQLLTVGSVIGDDEVLQVERDSILISSRGGTRRIERAQRGEAQLGTIAPAVVPGGNGEGNMDWDATGAAPMTHPGMRPGARDIRRGRSVPSAGEVNGDARDPYEMRRRRLEEVDADYESPEGR